MTLIRLGSILTTRHGALLAAALIAFLGARPVDAAPAPSRGSIRAAAQDLRGATFEYVPGEIRFDTLSVNGVAYTRVSVGGAVIAEAAGRPSLPTATIHVAVPDGMSPRLKIASEQWNERAGPPPPVPVVRQRFVSDDPGTGPVSVFETVPDPAVYARPGVFPTQAVELGRGAAVGEMWVVPVRIHPVRWDPAARAYRTLARMSVRVDFVPATDSEREGRPDFRSGGDVGAWRRVQEGLVKNFQSARSFPVRPKSMPRPAGRARLAVNPEFKIAVTATGWSSVNFAAMSAAGFPTGIQINTITLSERGYDDVGDSATVTPIPVVPRDNNFNGVFDAQDLITFYGQSLRDREGAGSVENHYTDANIYWLTWGAAPAAAMDSISGSIPGSATTPTSFRETIHMEQDQYMLASPNSGVASPPEAAAYFFWTSGEDPDQFDQPIPFVDPDVSQPFRIQSFYQGRSGSYHRLNIFYRSSSASTDTLLVQDGTFLNQEVYALDTGFSLPGTLIGAGTNRYKHRGDRQLLSGGAFVPGSAAFLDWIDVTYSRLYKPRNLMLNFNSGPGSTVELHVGNFLYSNIEVYDVTTPTAPRRVTDVTINPLTPDFDIVFRTDATAGERRFVALVPNFEIVLPPSAVTQDIPSTLTVPGGFSSTSLARSIIIAPQAFLTPANRLADFRRAQGYVVEVADIEDVYDEYNGGIKSARAIRRYLRHGYLRWTPRPTFVVLAGDASMDYQHRLSTSSVDWIPTYLQFESIAGPAGSELVAHDSHYYLNLAAVTPGDTDFTPSLFLARIPAGTATELDQYVTKVIQYENFQASDTWRGRMLLVSDDEFSSGIFSTSSYCYSPQEALFRQSNQNMADIANASQSGQDLTSNFYDLKFFTDPLPTFDDGFGNLCRNLQNVKTALDAPGGGYDQMGIQIGLGSLIVNFEAHANRYLIAHEEIYCATPTRCAAPIGPDRLVNYGRPCMLMVWGCHANQFPDGPATPLSDSTDALGEQWLLLPNTGSIGSLGSSGYEYLNTNSNYNSFVADAFFTTPPTPTPPPGEQRRARWIMGEVLGTAAVQNGMSGLGGQAVMNRTINLLGDPMLRMDALPPRVFEVKLDGTTYTDGGNFTSDSPTDSVTLVAKARDEAGLKKVTLAERDIASGIITPVDSTLYTITVADTGRQATLTTRARPRVGNYDLQVRAIDGNDRLQIFALQIRTPVRYLANGIVIVNGVFVENEAVLRAEVTTPIPVTADSLALYLDGVPITVTKTQTDAAGRQWVLKSLPEGRGPGSHVLQIAVGGRTAGFDKATYQVSAEFTMRGVAVVSQKVQGAGCGGSIFQYELSAPASKVELLLLTVAGRRVSSVQLPGSPGFNVFCWDGRDSQGHETATGLYLFRIRATDPSGRTVTRDGRMIRSR